MIVKTEYADIPVAGPRMRTFVAAPNEEGEYPGVWCYSDIFQLTPPLLRTCVRLAGYGFVVAAPEIYRRIEPAASKTQRKLPWRTSMPIAALVWIGFPNILKSRMEKSVRQVSALAGTWLSALLFSRMCAPRCVITARGFMMASSGKMQTRARWRAQKKFAESCS